MLFCADQFRLVFPEFSDLGKYPTSQVNFWGELAEAQVNKRRWRSQVLKGIQLYTAHLITLAAQNNASAQVGGTPGLQSGPANSKTVDSVTIAYDTVTISEKDGGWWNMTTYGKQFLRLARIFGSGAIQL